MSDQIQKNDRLFSRRSMLKGAAVAVTAGAGFSGVAAGKGGKGKSGGGNGGETAYAAPYEPAGEGECRDGYKSKVFKLWAGQDSDAGTVTISNDDDAISVSYDTNESADLKEVHVDVYSSSDAVPDKRPAPGRAQFTAENLYTDAHTVTASVGALDGGLDCGDDYYVIAHAALTGDDASDNDTDADSMDSNAGETAYAGGSQPYDGKTRGAWFYVAAYTVECCLYDISGSVYEDLDGSGTFDDTESGMSGIELALEDEAGTVVANTATDSDGAYTFEAIAGDEDYTVIVGPQDGYGATENGGSYEIVDLDADMTGIDFGYTEQSANDFTYNVETDYKKTSGTIKFEATSKPALGEDGRSESDTFTFTAGTADSELTVETKNQDTVAATITPGETVIMRNGFDVTWESRTATDDGTYEYVFTVRSDADNGTGALSYVAFDTDAPEGSISA
jgi:hypothetical protein